MRIYVSLIEMASGLSIRYCERIGKFVAPHAPCRLRAESWPVVTAKQIPV
jgi:hypothetical protein